MYPSACFVGLGLLSFVSAISTVTVSINTGECPATYSSSLASSFNDSGTSSSTSSVSSSISASTSTSTGMNSMTPAAGTGTTPSGAVAGGAAPSSAAPSSSAAPCPCPADNNQTVDDSLGYDYQITCDESFSLLQGPGANFAATFDDCMLACDAYVDQTTYDACTAAAYMPGDPENGYNCFLTTDADPGMAAESGACIATVPSGEQ